MSHERNWAWTLNQARYVLEATPTAGDVRVHLDTETPGFATFLANIDRQGQRPITSGFTWTLHPGRNELEVRPKNIAGREGIASKIVLEYNPLP